jgi:predicted MFS family arabinose efflux permease
MIAYVRDAGRGAETEALFWSVIGLATIVSPWIWSRVIARLPSGAAFAVLTGSTAAGAALPLFSGSMAVLLASACLFGSAVIMVVASTTAFVRRNVPPGGWPAAVGVMTTAFGVGQVLGPVATGWITDRWGSLAAGLWASVGLLMASAVIALAQRDYARPGEGEAFPPACSCEDRNPV